MRRAMKKIIIFLVLAIAVPSAAQESIAHRMERIEKDFGVSFVYSSSLNTRLTSSAGGEYGSSLGPALENTFKGSGIRYEVRKKNVILYPDRHSAPQKWTVSGHVTDASDGETLIGAAVCASCPGENSPSWTVTNEYGFYSLTLPAGEYDLEVSYLGYEHKSRRLELSGNVSAVFQLESSAAIDAASIISGRDAGFGSLRPGSSILSQSLIDNTSCILGEGDILKSVQIMPGVQNSIDGFSGINVRGGGLDENLIMLDGSALYNTSHLLGMMSVFEPEMVKKATFYKSAFPARYGGRASSVLDVRTKDGNLKETHSTISIGLLSDKISLNGPIIRDRLSYSLNGRIMHTGVVDPVMKAFGVPANYCFYDINAKLSYVAGASDRLYAGLYHGRDLFKFGEREKNHRHYYDENYAAYDLTMTERLQLGLQWGNTLGTLRWNHIFSPQLFANFTVAANGYNMALGDTDDLYVNDSGSETVTSSSFNVSSGIADIRTQADFDYSPSQKHSVKFGTEIIGHRFKPESSISINSMYSDGELQSGRETEIANGESYRSIEAAVYAEDNIRLSERFSVCPGLRISTFFTEGRTCLNPEPRLSARMEISGDLSAKASLTRMAQYVHMLSTGNVSLPTDTWVPVTRDIKPLISDQISAGVYYSGLKGWEMSLEGYWKTMDNVLEYLESNCSFSTTISWEDNVAMGRGRSYGAELLLEKVSGRATGLLAYTLSRSDRIFEDGSINQGKRFPYIYDRRHKINLMINYRFSDRTDASVNWAFASGPWVTLPERYVAAIGPDGLIHSRLSMTERNNYRLAPIHHLDAGVNFRKAKRNGERIWTFGVYNIYGAHNPTLVDIVVNNAKYDRADIPDRAIGITQRSMFLFIPSVNYTRRF